MTIEEVERLRVQEINGTLRLPHCDIDAFEYNKISLIAWGIYNINRSKNFLSKLINKLSLKKMGIKISGKGTKDEPYFVETPYGKGKFFNVNEIFKDKHCPFEVGNCFANAFNMAGEMIKLPNVEICDCVSGISWHRKNGVDSGMLHSVVELNNWIIDVNLGMVISKDLYRKLFLFEELCRISGDKIEPVIELLKKDSTKEISAKYNLRTYHLAMAAEDMVDFILNASRHDEHEVFQDLN